MKEMKEKDNVYDNVYSELVGGFDMETYKTMKEVEHLKYSHLTKKEREADIQPVRTEPKIQRNALCPCGSGRKYKKCCIDK